MPCKYELYFKLLRLSIPVCTLLYNSTVSWVPWDIFSWICMTVSCYPIAVVFQDCMMHVVSNIFTCDKYSDCIWFLLQVLKVNRITQPTPVAQLVEHGVSNAKIMGSIPRERQDLIKNVETVTWMQCKSLWIKASAKCINVNVTHHSN